MYIVFFSTSDVFDGEDVIRNNGLTCEVVPTPVTDKAYCGVCLQVQNDLDLSILGDLEYNVIEEV